MLSVFNEVSKYWLEGAVRSLDGIRHGLRSEYPLDTDPPPTTPYRVVFEGGKTKLRYYAPVGQPLSTPLLLVYSLVKRPYILDLMPRRSVVETLTNQGVPVYFIDWIPPTPDDTGRGFDAYLNGDLAAAIDVVRKREGVDRVSLLGYCFGGLLTTLYTALYPAQVRNLVNFTLPLDMSVKELPFQSLMGRMSPAMTDLIVATYGNCPAWLMKAGFEGMAPLHHAFDKYVGLYRAKEQRGYVEMFELFERWMNSDVPMAGRIFKEMQEEVSRRNLVVKNRFQVNGRTVDLKAIECPVLNVIGEHDDVVHPKSSLPLVDLVGSPDAANLVFPTGHIGAAVSSGAQKRLWPQVGAWLRERDTEIGH